MVSYFFPDQGKINLYLYIVTKRNIKYNLSLQEPIQLKAGDQIVVHFWRQCNSKNVWYEWCISEPFPGPIHNPGGRSYTIGL